MLTRAEALAAVASTIAELNCHRQLDDQVVVCDEETIERDLIFAFAYNSKKYIETGDERYMLYGCGPIIVNRRTGAVKVCGTNRSPVEFIDDYERKAEAGVW